MRASDNPLVDDRLIDLLLHEVVRADELCALPAFAEHSPGTFDLYVASCRRLAREVLFPAYRALDAEPPTFDGERVRLHPRMPALVAQLVDLGVITATRPLTVGGQRLPLSVATLAHAYLIAANAAAAGLVWLTAGAGHLIERFGGDALEATFLTPMYEGRWSGTMALTEPHAGSSLADLTTRASANDDGTYSIRGSKIFISGGDHDAAENIVHLTLARIDGAPAGTRGVSLFAVPALRPEGERLVPNDVSVSGVIHKIGWRGLPSVALSFGDQGDCRGWLVGEPNRGLAQMFQMMNEARISVGVSAAATASVAYQEALAYARERRQGRPAASRDPESAPVAIIEHPDVRRMLLRQKAIVEGSLALAATTARFADLAEHAVGEDERARAQRLVDLLTPVTKTFPSERGFEANVLAVQIHAGYGYTSEYLPEAWMRDQKLNSIHEGTTGIQGLDLLGRKVMASGGAALADLAVVVRDDLEAAHASGLEPTSTGEVARTLQRIGALTMILGQRGLSGDVEGMLAHSADYLELFSIAIIAWMHVKLATAAARRLREDPGDPFASGLAESARYWIATEVPRIEHLARLCEDGEGSYVRMKSEWF